MWPHEQGHYGASRGITEFSFVFVCEQQVGEMPRNGTLLVSWSEVRTNRDKRCSSNWFHFVLPRSVVLHHPHGCRQTDKANDTVQLRLNRSKCKRVSCPLTVERLISPNDIRTKRLRFSALAIVVSPVNFKSVWFLAGLEHDRRCFSYDSVFHRPILYSRSWD